MSKRASEATGGGAAPPPPPPEAMAAFFSMFDAVTGHILPSCVHAAAKLGIADAIGDDTLTLQQLASKLSVTHTEGLFRLMRFLIAHDIFAEEQTPGAAEDGAGDKSVDEERGYKNNTKSSFLRENAPMSLWGMARHMRDGAPTWTCLPGFLIKGADAEGASPFGMYYGEELFEWVSKDEGRTAEFSHAMTGIAAQRAHVISGLDTSVASGDGDIIVDIGGARGALLPPLLGPRPSARGVVFDLPHVVAEAQGTLRAAVEGATASSNPSQDLAGDVAALLPVKDRVNFVAGNFFETDDVPKGGAAYLLALILHDWGDEDCVRILKNIANAMRDDGTIVICEMVVAEPPKDDIKAVMVDVNMLDYCVGGRERTRSEFKSILGQAGLHMEKVQVTVGMHGLLYARKVSG